MGVEWIQYKGKTIIYINYVGLQPAEMGELVKKATQAIVASKSDKILSLSNVTGCLFNKEILDIIKEQGAISLPLTEKAAVVGVTGIKNVFLTAVNAVMPKSRKPFDTEELAKEWLIG